MAKVGARVPPPRGSLIMPELFMDVGLDEPDKAPSRNKPGGSHKFPPWHEQEHLGNLAGRRSAGITKLVAKGNEGMHFINDYAKKRQS